MHYQRTSQLILAIANLSTLLACMQISTAGASTTMQHTAREAVHCARDIPSLPASQRNAQQIVVVRATSLRSVTAVVTLLVKHGACFVDQGGPWRAEVGRNGFSAHKTEGDGTTPTGVYGFGATMYGVRPNPGVAYSYRQLVCGDWWDEAPSSSDYNHFVHVICGTQPPFGGASEALWRTVPQYDYFAAISYNSNPIIKGRGSAIFLHVSAGVPTSGCIALPSAELLAVIKWFRPTAHPVIAISA